MKIVSKFSDYYDVGLSFGIDHKIYYERTMKKLLEDLNVNIRKVDKDYGDNTYLFYPGVIGFCGEIYPFVFVEKYEKKKGNYISNEKLIERDCFYNKKELNDYIKDKKESSYPFMFNPENMLDYNDKELKIFKEVFEKYDTPLFSYTNIHLDDFNVPEAIRTTGGLVLNPKLFKYKFNKVKDPIVAFQEISMYLGKQKNPEIEVSDMDDKVIAQSKGFGCMSFKKQGKKKHSC